MPVYRYPVLVIEDHNGLWTAISAESLDIPPAIDEQPREAVSQLRKAMLKLSSKDEYLPAPSFEKPELITVPVSVRAEYSVAGRSYPCRKNIELKVHCIRGKESGGDSFVCTIPLLSIEFNYYKQSDVRKLVKHFVTEQLNGRTPGQLTAYLAIKSARLEEMSVNINQSYRQLQNQNRFPTLESVTVPLTDAAVRKRYSRAIERETIVADLSQRLIQEKSSILLVGEPGCGKTSVLIDVARKVEKDLGSGAGRRFWQTSGSRIIAGMKYLGEWQERCEQLIRELAENQGTLCLDSLVDVMSGKTEESVAAFLLPFIRFGELRVICETTPEALTTCEQMFPAFLEPFQIVRLEPFSREQAMRIMDRTAATLMQNSKTEFEELVLELVYDLFKRFMPYRSFPGPVISFVKKIWDLNTKAKCELIKKEDVLQQFMLDTGLNEVFVRDDLPLKEEDAMAWFQERIIGQEQACTAAAGAATLFKSAMSDPKRPVSVLFFCGPTGVGKTALANAMSDYFFGASKKKHGLIRLDMSEYGTPGAIDRLLGYGKDEAGSFISKVRQQPFSVVLLDEVEKAHPEVFDLLLNVLDEGRLVDKLGRSTSFRSSIIIMTSNIGAAKSPSIGFSKQKDHEVESDVMKYFRPEFFNRIDQVITFHGLDESTIKAITRKELQDLTKREGLARREITIDWSDDVVNHLAGLGFDIRWGARQLLRTIEEEVVTPLSAYLLENPKQKKTRLAAELIDNKVVFG